MCLKSIVDKSHALPTEQYALIFGAEAVAHHFIISKLINYS